MVFRELPDRISMFCRLVQNVSLLRRTENRDKTVAVVYYKGPGRNALTATGLDVVPSLHALLTTLDSVGYNVEGVPGTPWELFERIQRQGRVIGPYAKGAAQEFLEIGHPERVYADTLRAWMDEELPKELVDAVEQTYGPCPGEYLSGTDSTGRAYVAVPRIRFGSVVLLPQLHPGRGEDEAGAGRGGKFSPPYPYIAQYLWIRKGLRAHALIHFGTYGSFEFLPYKQPPLSRLDWPDALLGPMPHLYVYCVESVGDALIAKRRSYATIITHLTPPFKPSGTYGGLHELKTKLDAFWGAGSEPLREQYRRTVTELVGETGVLRDLGMERDTLTPLSDDDVRRVTDQMQVIAQEKIHEGLYVLGRTYSEDQLRSTCKEICVEMLAHRQAQLDVARGVVPAERIRDRVWFDRNYRASSYAMADSILKGLRSPDHYVAPRDRALLARLKETVAPAPHEATIKEALDEYVQVLEQLVPFHRDLASSPRMELAAIVNGLNGGYVAPSSGGDPIVNPGSVPTGKNMYGVNAERTPDEEAWRTGVELAEQLLRKRLVENGAYPRKVAFTLWGGEFIRDRGTTVAQILHLLGVRPVTSNGGIVRDVALVPCDALKRPRVDVVVQTSGQFRDLAASRIHLIEKAVRLASEADDAGECLNMVRQGTVGMERSLKARGFSPQESRALSTARVFGAVNGRYGAGIRELVQSGDQWAESQEIAERYLANMGAVYTETGWGEYKDGLFAAALENTEVISQSVNSHITGPLALDNVYEFMGGLSAAVRMLSGRAPDGFFNDLRNRFDPRVRDAREMLWTEARASVLNPAYIRPLIQGHGSSYESVAETFRICFGWNALTPHLIDHGMWERLHQTYVRDAHGLGVTDSFRVRNPHALQEMTAVLLESSRKGFWKASPNVIREVARLHADLVRDYKPGCSIAVCNNAKLSELISRGLDPEHRNSYTQAVAAVREARAERSAVALRKVGDDRVTRFLSENMESLVILAIIVALVAGAVVWGRLRGGREQ